MIRKTAAAGMFYDADKNGLINSIEESFLGKLGPGRLPSVKKPRIGNVTGLVCPHAGYIYSGCAAAHSYFALANDGLPDTIVILGPNHYGLGSGVAIDSNTMWETPLASSFVDMDTADYILEKSKFAVKDSFAHIKEHSIEVQIPFIQYLCGDKAKIVPISFSNFRLEDSIELSKDLGSAIAFALEGKNAVIIASTDFTHYESKASASAKDAKAMDKIVNLDSIGLLETVHSESITMCGAQGVAIMLEACKILGAKSARKLTYYTSGDVTGNKDEVVGYGAMAVEK